ncbi:FtsW/RodA/SpoVE family cell cycle protein [Thalassobacillus sp. CUG 92003]|uniref:FtsW/RodA/SpoVE family cell cycle protein n=1 Tax=Thalassobacillus sp. CUG 92003 TaxID=2736641 RepID=UPI0015E76FEA|nr:FtsW/RodA/SpoVE family cell cycle protein [Thalassobacillus sp. CUG 92003]
MKFEQRFDWRLFFIMIALVVISCFAIYSAQQSGQYNVNFMVQQLIWYGLGSVMIGFMLLLDPESYKKVSLYLYIFGIILLAGLMVAPNELAPLRNGSRSWYIIPGLGSIQPSEFMKIFLILMLSKVVTDHNYRRKTADMKSDVLLLGKMVLVVIPPLFLIMLQPDLGTALVFLAILAGTTLVSGVAWRLIIPIYGAASFLGVSLVWLALQAPQLLDKYLNVQEYQLGRIYAWLQPFKYESSDGYHLIKSMRAIGSGQMYGKGVGGSEVYLPESHTDFIFSVIGEEYGFIGSCVVIMTFFILMYHLIQIAHRANYAFSSYVVVGILSMIGFHVFQNIGMTVQLLPITGIPLPFISYGGSALLANLIAIGLVFAVHFHQKTFMFNEGRLDE